MKKIAELLAVGVAIAAFLAPAVGAQEVVARQGARQEGPIEEEFESPMVLEIPLGWLGRLERGQGQALGPEISNYVCDDVSLVTLRVSRGKGGGKTRAVVEFLGFVSVRNSYDRLVDLDLSLLSGEKAIASAVIHRVDAEENKNTKFQAQMTIPRAEFEAAFEGEPQPTLKIVMRVQDNKYVWWPWKPKPWKPPERRK